MNHKASKTAGCWPWCSINHNLGRISEQMFTQTALYRMSGKKYPLQVLTSPTPTCSQCSIYNYSNHILGRVPHNTVVSDLLYYLPPPTVIERNSAPLSLPPKGFSFGHCSILTYSTQCSGRRGFDAIVHSG